MSSATALERISGNVIRVVAVLAMFPVWFLSMYPSLAFPGD
jgi:hypothetical protein